MGNGNRGQIRYQRLKVYRVGSVLPRPLIVLLYIGNQDSLRWGRWAGWDFGDVIVIELGKVEDVVEI